MTTESLSAAIEAHALAEPHGRLLDIIPRIVDAVRAQLANIPDSAKSMLRDAALSAYDRIAAAYDVPYIGEPFETMAEQLLRDGLANLLNGLLGLEAV